MLKNSFVSLFKFRRILTSSFVVIGLLLQGYLVKAEAAPESFRPLLEDRAGFFSANTIIQAEKIIAEVYTNTRPPKEVVVITIPSLSPDKNALQAAEEAFQERRVNGILIYIVKNPHKLEIVVGRNTKEQFPEGYRLHELMLDHFRRGSYDEGLLEGLRFLKTNLLQPDVSRNMQVQTETHSRTWLWVLLLGGGIAIILFMIRRRNQSGHMGGTGSTNIPPGPYTSGGPYGGYPGPDSGGWAKPVLGGIAGAMAGNWLYDQVTGRQGHVGAAPLPGSVNNHDDWLRPDTGQVGETFGDTGSESDWGAESDDSASGNGNDW